MKSSHLYSRQKFRSRPPGTLAGWNQAEPLIFSRDTLLLSSKHLWCGSTVLVVYSESVAYGHRQFQNLVNDCCATNQMNVISNSGLEIENTSSDITRLKTFHRSNIYVYREINYMKWTHFLLIRGFFDMEIIAYSISVQQSLFLCLNCSPYVTDGRKFCRSHIFLIDM